MGNIKNIVLDVDGTLTDGKLYITADGEFMKAFNVKDGYGIKDLLPQYGVKPIVITGRTSEILSKRCAELNIDICAQGVKDKDAYLSTLLDKLGVSFNEVAYIGDDDNDLPAMAKCGIKGCPIDASPRVKNIANFVSSRKGGEGAVREFIEWLVDNRHFRA